MQFTLHVRVKRLFPTMQNNHIMFTNYDFLNKCLQNLYRIVQCKYILVSISYIIVTRIFFFIYVDIIKCLNHQL